jgi:hypothetical protein
MARLLRVHFASIGHADARLAPLTVDLRARDAAGTGADSVLWLRNGGGKSTILNLFYSLFRPDRREFLGTSAEGKARHLEDYIKAEDLAFVVTEWDVEPVSDELLFARAPARRRLVGQVLSWKDRQKSSDPSKLRRRFFSLRAEPGVELDELPIDGLGQEPVRSWDAFRTWLEDLRQRRPDLEVYWEDTPRKWTEHLERIGLDPELFRYQLKMNAREGSADEAFRFRTTDEFIRFYLEIAFDSSEADAVSANVEGFREKLGRRPDLLAEQTFLIDARHSLIPLREAVAAARAAEGKHDEQRALAASVARALVGRQAELQRIEARAEAAASRAKDGALQASNDSARLGRWANGLDRRALELEVDEAEAARKAAEVELATADEQVLVAEGAVARDARHRVQADRDAKAEALRLAEIEQEPLRRQVARAGSTLRARLDEAAANKDAEAARQRDLERGSAEARDACDQRRDHRLREDASLATEIRGIDAWLADRDRARDSLRADALIELREEAAGAVERWTSAAASARAEAATQALARDTALARAEAADGEITELSNAIAAGTVAIENGERQLRSAYDERSRLQGLSVVRDVEGVDAVDLDAPGLVDRLRSEAEAAHRRLLVAAVDGAEDERAWQALDRTGRLPPTADVERALLALKSAGVAAWSGPEYLAGNLSDPAERERLVRGDPAAWHGVVVPDSAWLTKAEAILATFTPRMPVTVGVAHLTAEPDRGRVVLPGHAAHWDTRAGGILRDELGDRRKSRDRQREEHKARERAGSEAANAVERWRSVWGEGRLAIAESDQEQRTATRDRQQALLVGAKTVAKAARDQAAAAESAREAAIARGTAAERKAERVQRFVEQFEAEVEAKRDQRAGAAERRVEIATELDALAVVRTNHDAASLLARDAAAEARRDTEALQAERDGVELTDDEPADPLDLIQARARWAALHAQWSKLVSENRLKWELERLEQELKELQVKEREAVRGREGAVSRVAVGDGAAAASEAGPARSAANNRAIEARLVEANARKALADGGKRRRDAEDLPADEPAPTSARKARERAERCRAEREVANRRHEEHRDASARYTNEQREAATEAGHCEQRVKRLQDALGALTEGDAAPLPEHPAAVDALVDARVRGVRSAMDDLDRARKAAETRSESLREVALSSRHEVHRSRVKERLKAPAQELELVADELHRDIEERLEVVRSALRDIDHDRRLVLQQLEKVAMDGVHLLQAAERASRLPAGLGVWEGESFLRIRIEVAGGQAERQARLEPLLDRLIAKGVVPAGRELVDAAVRELGGPRIDATLLKPDALLRRDRLPVTEMQTFSRGQQLTVAILLYCTMARLRAQQRGRANRPDAGVLLLDNPVGTCSSVPLLEIQRQVARQMRVQLVYTTGVNDPNAVATFPNTVRLRNAHRARSTGDLHVTVDDGGVQAIRVVAT